MSPLNDIVQRAYQIFAGNSPQEEIDACIYCCMTKEQAKEIKTLLLQLIPVELLKEYQDAAKPNELNLSELKYFAPRYLELVKEYQFPSFEPLLSLRRFGYIPSDAWSPEERKILDEFAFYYFKDFLNKTVFDTYISSIDILLMFYKGNFNLQHLLDIWEKSSSTANLIHFNELMDNISKGKQNKPKVTDAFSDEKFSNIICNWLFSDKIKSKFKNQIEQELLNPNSTLNESEKEKLSLIYELIK